MFKDKKIKFKFQSSYIDSVFAFEDGDFILFGAGKENSKSKYPSPLYDGKTLKPKFGFEVTSIYSFFNLKNDEFCIYNDFRLASLNKFKDNRTSFQLIQNFNTGDMGSIKGVSQLSNGDICLLKVGTGYNGLYIFRKIDPDSKVAPYGEMFFNHLEDINEIVDLNEKEVLGIQKNFAGIDSIILKIIDTNNYKIIRQNEIKTRENNINRLTVSSNTNIPFQKTRGNKLINAVSDCIYIFGLDTLELETTICFDNVIKNILIRPKGNIFLRTKGKDKILDNRIFKETPVIRSYSNFHYIKLDYEKNDIKFSKEEDITEYCQNHEDLFFFYNYINNGFITLTDKKEVIIYDDFGDDNE